MTDEAGEAQASSQNAWIPFMKIYRHVVSRSRDEGVKQKKVFQVKGLLSGREKKQGSK